MKNLLVLSTLFLLGLNSVSAKTLVVSDVDDTIKVTNVLNKISTVYNALFSTKAFVGMSTVYNGLNNPETKIVYVSGSPELVRGKINKLLTVNNFPQKENLILKPSKQDTFDYKFSVISKLINKENPDDVILLGDDTEKDPEIFDALSKTYPEKIKSMHIHLIRNRQLPNNDKMNGFFTSIEIAGRELLNGKITSDVMSNTAKLIVAEKSTSKIYINYRYCPKEGRNEVEELKQKVSNQSLIDSLESVQAKTKLVCTDHEYLEELRELDGWN